MSLTDQTVLVDMGFSTPKLTAVDKAASAKACEMAGAKRGRGRVVKTLYADTDIKMVTNFRDEVRTYYYRMTAPWLNNGCRILPSALYFEFCERMRAYRATWESTIVPTFCDNFADRLDRAEKDLAGLWNPRDYPTVEDVRSRFEMRVNILPVPSSGDFRVQLGEEANAKLEADLEEINRQVEAKVMTEVKDRLLKVVGTMAENLTGGKKIFDTLVTNVTDLCNVLPAFNVTNDPRIEQFRAEIMAKLAEHPDNLRSDKKLAKQVGDDAQAIVDKMSAYFGQ
jgi:hypothetical protein